MPLPAHPREPESWNRTASAYEALFLPFSERVAEAALARIALVPGERFLDVAAGTGAVCTRAAAAGARVSAVDFSAGMLELLRNKLAALPDRSIDVRQMDGQALAFPDDAFDAAGSNLGLVFFPDPAAGLRELRRVLRPGGRAFVTSLAAQPPPRLMQLVMGAVFATVPDFRPPEPPTPLHYAGVEPMQEAFAAAGFAEAGAEAVEIDWPLADPERFWRGWALESPPTARMMSALTPAQREAAGARFVELARSGPPGFASTVVIGLGTAPRASG